MLWAILATLALFALALLYAGIRGRRIDDHPICRRCRFDLVGVYPGRECCPECGASLRSPTATRTGNRRSRRRLLATGAVTFLIVIAVGGIAGWSSATSFDWNTVKPTWLLARELRSADPSTASPALEELHRRLGSGLLAPAAATAAADAVLDIHAQGFTTPLSRFIEQLWQQGLLSPEQAHRYITRALPLRVTARERVVQGDILPFRFQIDNRTGNRGMVGIEAALLDVSIGETRHEAGWHLRTAPGIPTGRIIDAPRFIFDVPHHHRAGDEIPITVPPGEYELRTVWLVARGWTKGETMMQSRSFALPLRAPHPETRDNDLARLARKLLAAGDHGGRSAMPVSATPLQGL